MIVARQLRRIAVLVVFGGLPAAAAALAQQPVQTMLVHLPSAPVESATRQAEAVTALAKELSRALPGPPLELKIFRRLADAQSFLAENGDTVALALCDAALAADLPAGLDPSHRFVHRGRPTYRRLAVVRDERRELQKLEDLRGRSLAVVETAGSGEHDFLAWQVFAGALDPKDWFGSLEPAADDFAATASALYGQTDAALVAEYNPLLIKNLDGELRVIYRSPPLSLPVLAVRAAAFDDARRAALDEALRALAGSSALIAALGLDGFEAVAGRGELFAVSDLVRKRPELAAPQAGAVPVEVPPLPAATDLPFVLAIELPDVEIDPEIFGVD